MHRTFRIYFALYSAVIVADSTATPDLSSALQYPQLPKKQQEASYQAAALIAQQSTQQPTFHELTHQGPHPSWLDLPNTPSPSSNIQRIPNPKPPPQQYPQSSQSSLQGNQSVFIDIPTNNLPIHREEVEYNPYQSNGRPNWSGRTQTSLATLSTSVTASTPQYTLPQINPSEVYSTQRVGQNFIPPRSGVPNQSFDTKSIRVQPSIYQQPPTSNGPTAFVTSSTPSSLLSSTSQPGGSQYSASPNQGFEAGNGYSQTGGGSSGRGFENQINTRLGNRFGDESESYPQTRGQSGPRSGNGYSQTGAEYSGRRSDNLPRTQSRGSSRFGDQTGSYPNQPRTQSRDSGLKPRFGDQAGSYPQINGQNQPRTRPRDSDLNQVGDLAGTYPQINDQTPGNQFGLQPLSYPSNSIAVQPAAYPMPAFEGGPLLTPTPTILVPSSPQPIGSSPIYFVSSTPTTPANSLGPEFSQSPPVQSSSSYPQSSYAGQGSYPQSPNGRKPPPNRGSSVYPSFQTSFGTTTTPIIARGGQSYPVSSYGLQGGYDQSQSQGPISTTATPIVAGQSYPVSTYGGQGGYSSINNVTPGGKSVNRGQTRFSTETPNGEPENYPENFPQLPGNSQAYPSPNRGQVKFATSTSYPQTSTARSYPQSSAESYPRVSSTVPPQTFTLSSTLEPYPSRRTSGRSKSEVPRTASPQYPASASSSFPGSSFSGGASSTLSSSSPTYASPSAIPPQPSEPSYPQPGPPYQQPPSIAAQYNPNAPKPLPPNSLSYPQSRNFPSPSYSTNQVFGSNSIAASGPSVTDSSSTAAPSIYDYGHNPFLRPLIPGASKDSGYAPGFLQARPVFSTVSPAQRRNDVTNQGSLSTTPAYGNVQTSVSEPAQPTADCPHQFGYYRLGDQAHCSQYMNCANGVGYLQTCPEGLAFNELTIRCDWPDEVPTCDAESFLGLTCPQPTGNAQDSDKPPNFAHPTEPTKYFSCQNGRPRLHTCPGPFNPTTSLCQGAENEEQPEITNDGAGSNLQFAPQPSRVGY